MRIEEIRGMTIRLTLEIEDACVLVAALERACHAGDMPQAEFAACQGMACALEVAVFTTTLIPETAGIGGRLDVTSRRNVHEKAAGAAA